MRIERMLMPRGPLPSTPIPANRSSRKRPPPQGSKATEPGGHGLQRAGSLHVGDVDIRTDAEARREVFPHRGTGLWRKEGPRVFSCLPYVMSAEMTPSGNQRQERDRDVSPRIAETLSLSESGHTANYCCHTGRSREALIHEKGLPGHREKKGGHHRVQPRTPRARPACRAHLLPF